MTCPKGHMVEKYSNRCLHCPHCRKLLGLP